MSTPATYVPGTVERPVSPSAVTGPKAASVFKVAQVLKELIHAVPHAFDTENAQIDAVNAIDSWSNAHAPASELGGMDTESRAQVEDVTKRVAPQSVAYSVPSNVPAIDYDRLAAAMLRAQQAQANKEAVQE